MILVPSKRYRKSDPFELENLQIITHHRSDTIIHGDLVEVSSYLHVLTYWNGSSA